MEVAAATVTVGSCHRHLTLVRSNMKIHRETHDHGPDRPLARVRFARKCLLEGFLVARLD